MNRIEILNAAEILNSCTIITYNWKTLHAGLEIQENYVQLEQQFKSGVLQSRELFHTILTQWSSEKGSDATVQKLCTILENMNYRHVSEKLKRSCTNIDGNMDLAAGANQNELAESQKGNDDVKISRSVLKRNHSLNRPRIIIIFTSVFAIIVAIFVHFWVTYNFKCIQEQQLQVTLSSTELTFIDKISPIKTFVGRTEEINQLQKLFKDPNINIAKVVGLGGIGKTELVKTFANINSQNVSTIWLNGESQESLQQSIIKLGLSLSVPIIGYDKIPRNYIKVFQDVITSFKVRYEFPILLIIDNVDATNNNVAVIIQQAEKFNFFALVTSRQLNVLNFAGEIINLDVLKPQDAKQLVNDSMEEENDKDVNKLTHLLQYFPLALQQAIAYIKAQKITTLEGKSYKIQNYLNEYENKKSSILGFKLNSIEHQYGFTTMMTWNISIDQIKQTVGTGKHAIHLLNLMSYCEADGISVDLLQSFVSDIDRSITIKAVELIKLYSLVNVENNTISIHRLVQEVIRLHCTTLYPETDWVTQMFQTIYFYGFNTPFTNIEQQLLNKICHCLTVQLLNSLKCNDILHILSMLTHAFKYDQLVKEFSNVPNNVLDRLQELSLFREILQFANSCYDHYIIVLGREHLETLRAQRQIALAVLKNGMYRDALDKYREVLMQQKRVLGEKHELTLTTGYEMALVLLYLNQYEESVQQYQTVLELQKRVLGESHKDTMATWQSMASVFTHQGKLSQGMNINEEVLYWQIIELGPEHESTLRTKHDIGHCLYEQKKIIIARRKLLGVFRSKGKVLGDEHYRTQATKCILAVSLNDLGKIEEALQMLREVFVSQKKSLGEGHPRTLTTRNHIANILYNKQDYEEAKNIFQNDLPLWIKSCGADHPETLKTKSGLASALHKLGESDDALELYQQVFVSGKKISRINRCFKYELRS